MSAVVAEPVPSREELVEETLGLMRRVLARAFAPRRRKGTLSFFSLDHLALHFVVHRRGASQAEVAKFLGVTPGHVTGIVDTLEREGMVRRAPDDVDRRVHRIEATVRAREFHRRFHEKGSEMAPPLFDLWTDEEIESFRALLKKLDQDRPATQLQVSAKSEPVRHATHP
jgi:DNA-binding MarR family transcriptional regulator